MNAGRPRPLVLDVAPLFATTGSEAQRTVLGALAAEPDRFAALIRTDTSGVHAVRPADLARRLAALATADPMAPLCAWLTGQGPRPDVAAPVRATLRSWASRARASAAAMPPDAILVATAVDDGDLCRDALFRARPDLALVSLVDDVTALDWPEYAPDGPPHVGRLEALVASASAIVVPDAASAARIEACRGARDGRAPVEVVEPPGLPMAASDDDDLADADYCLAVDSVEAGANTALLLHIWRDLLAEGGSVPKLVLAGARGASIEEIKPLIGWNETVRRHVVEAPGLAPGSLARLVCHARLVLAPAFAMRTPWLLGDMARLGAPMAVADHLDAPTQARRLSAIDGPAWREAVRSAPLAGRPPPPPGRSSSDVVAAILALAARF